MFSITFRASICGRRRADATFLLNFIFSILVGYGVYMIECGKKIIYSKS